MKTKVFALVCLFLGFGISVIYAQLPPVIPEGTKSIKTDFFFPGWTEYVTCDGVEDVLVGDITLQETDLFKDGESIRGINHAVKGTLVSQFTGEVFHFNFNCKGYLPLDADGNFTNGMWRTHIVGDKGNHYIGSFSFYEDGSWTTDKLNCSVGNKK